MEDLKLILAIKNGKMELYELLIQKYYEKVYYYCYRQVNQKQAAQDITQDVFMKVMNRIDQYQHYGKFENYLYVIARNQCHDFRKKESHYVLKDIEELPTHHEVIQLDNKLLVEDVLNQLPDDERDLLILRFYQDLKIKDIAKIKKWGTSITKYRLKKAMELFESQMRGESNE